MALTEIVLGSVGLHRLTEAGDEELVRRYREGDRQAADFLLQRYRGIARSKARSYFVPGGDRDDVIQEGMIGLYKAIRDFDPGRERSFGTFADVCITRQVISAVKMARRHKHAPLNAYVSLSGPATGEGEDAGMLQAVLATVADPSDVVISGDEIRAMRHAFAEVLSDFETDVLHFYVEGKSYRAIAGTLGCTAKAVDNAVQRIRRKVDLHLRSRDEDA
ncbi:MAG TPA: RNA polymerase sporulation sigma factor SigH [Actinomycetota bacterium]